MLALTVPVERTPVHRREVRFQGYHRSDGLWDIDAEIADAKHYPLCTKDGRPVEPGDDVHRMRIRMTLDDQFVVRALEAVTVQAPFGECQAAVPPMQRMVGVQVGPGWRRRIDEHLGGVRGCTHLRELLFNMATAAFQTIPHYREAVLRQAPRADGPPPYIGGCLGWDFDGPVVRRVAPEFYRWRQRSGSGGAA